MTLTFAKETSFIESEFERLGIIAFSIQVAPVLKPCIKSSRADAFFRVKIAFFLDEPAYNIHFIPVCLGCLSDDRRDVQTACLIPGQTTLHQPREAAFSLL